jgi:hypothetical protein
MSFKAEVIADNTGKWCGNALRFATQAEAKRYVDALAWRWTAVRDTRTVESDDPVDSVCHENGRIEELKKEPA